MSRMISIISLVLSAGAVAGGIFFHRNPERQSVDLIRMKAIVDGECWHREMLAAKEWSNERGSHPEAPDLFLKIMVDAAENGGPKNRAMFSSGPLPPDDKPRVTPGGRFQFNIGYKF